MITGKLKWVSTRNNTSLQKVLNMDFLRFQACTSNSVKGVLKTKREYPEIILYKFRRVCAEFYYNKIFKNINRRVLPKLKPAVLMPNAHDRRSFFFLGRLSL
jgi:hypothetical protein